MRLRLGDVLQRDVGRIGVLVVQHRVAMEEGAAAAVLAGEAHPEAVLDQGGVGERLGATPVERQLPGEHLAAVGDDLRHARVQREVRAAGS